MSDPMRETSYTSATPANTQAFAAELAQTLRSGDVLALHGELGAGKTCFVRGLAQGLGIDPHHVASPTFVLMHEYEIPTPGDNPQSPVVLIHVDAYRLTGSDEWDTLGLDVENDLAEQRAVLVVEWADRVRNQLGTNVQHITLRHTESGREMVVRKP